MEEGKEQERKGLREERKQEGAEMTYKYVICPSPARIYIIFATLWLFTCSAIPLSPKVFHYYFINVSFLLLEAILE